MHPLIFHPLLKRARWGGRRLGTELLKTIGPEADYAESWEIADHGSDQSVVAAGEYAGRTLRSLVRDQQISADLIGTDCDQFPLLIKFLDANDWLSLQVHPNDDQARQVRPDARGKTEAWIVVDAAPGSEICAGLRDGTTPDQLAEALQHGRCDDVIHRFEVRSGDCVFVPAGTVHAIGSGILIAEIQQQSDITYRLHDWGKVGSDGRPRELHIEQSLSCIDFSRGPLDPVVPVATMIDGCPCEELVRDRYFSIHRHTGDHPFCVTDGRFHILVVIDGKIRCEYDGHSCERRRGETLLVPAVGPPVQVLPMPSATVLNVTAAG